MNENEKPTDEKPTDDHQYREHGGVPADGTAPAPPAPPATSKRRLGRPAIIGIGVGAALLLAGGGLAIGMEIADDRDDSPAAAADRAARADDGDRADRDADRGDDADDRGDLADDRDGLGQDAGPGASLPASDGAALRDAAEAAIAAVDGAGATSIDVEAGGYEVEVLLSGGTETDVFVPADGGEAELIDRDDSDTTRDPALDLDGLDRIVAAALEEASRVSDGADGRVDSVSSSDDRGVASEVTVRLDADREVEVALDADLGVLSTDLDD
ncbi:hypothetical protein JD276_04805 [Leucobacter sp. CSA1]|uniref:PepSY domain-containing protein n=1 Tax=Leucobacter chromiisoli TaxID=2796471 RepID=A0A934Q780_9MICO|nr:hypothetical protein [Leucobacter chromiisoli]MBK0418351.1 hypothetical protein [Leucobacter chromiisoli]